MGRPLFQNTGCRDFHDARRIARREVLRLGGLTGLSLTLPERGLVAVAWVLLTLSWSETLLAPTFNRLPVRPNSSYDLTATRIHDEPAERWRAELDPEIVAIVEERALELHAEVHALADLS